MMIRRFIPLPVMLVAAGFAIGQAPPPKLAPPAKEVPKQASKEPAKPAPGSLEDTLDKVLRSSPDIKASEAKVRDAEAELNRVRHQVLTKATALHSDLNLAKRMLVITEQTLARQNEMVKAGTVSVETILTSQALVEKHRGEVEKLETELKSLRGEFAGKWLSNLAISADGRYVAGSDGVVRLLDSATGALLGGYLADGLAGSVAWTRPKVEAVQTPMAARVKKLLDQEVEADMSNIIVSETFNALLDTAGTDIPHRVLAKNSDEATITLKGKMVLGAWFQALEDTDPNICIVVRDYGLLMTRRDRMPSSAVGVSDLWKAKEVKPPEEKK